MTVASFGPEMSLDLGSDRGARIAARFFAGLADPARLRILGLLLRGEEMTVGEMVDAVEVGQPRVSSQLACLRRCGIVTDRKHGRHVFYPVPDPRLRALLEVALAIVGDHAAHISDCYEIDRRR